MPTSAPAAGIDKPASIPVEYDWSCALDGTMLAVAGAPAAWEKLHFSDGEAVKTVSVGIMTRHEAMVTRAVHDGSWQLIAYGPLVIAVQVEG